MTPPPAQVIENRLPVQCYDLAATLASGQAFRWQPFANGWEGVVVDRWVRLEQSSDEEIIAITTRNPASTSRPNKREENWEWLQDYLQLKVNLEPILESFPNDTPMQSSVEACQGLRLLRQDPWECLASFILSSNKQIVQIQQIIATLCHRHGKPLPVPGGHPSAWSFPTVSEMAALREQDLRDCKMGYRAPYLLQTSRMILEGEIDLEKIRTLPLEKARREITRCPGVGPKIADCVLLFAYGFSKAFPVDVWVRRALVQLYFPKRHPKQKRLERFIQTYFGENAGYAQQYLFHYMRTQVL